MTHERESQLASLFREIRLLEEVERQARLEAIHRDEPQLGTELRSLLDADAEASILDHPIQLEDFDDGATPEPAPNMVRPGVGSSLGPYEILRLLGKGGMGEVYLAQQRTPVQRIVAIKILRPHRATPEMLTRFEGERQALALLESTNVARILDVGTSEEGGAFFALEYIDGTPINDYCNAGALTLEKRLRLFLQVCRGIEDAHQRGVIHRDIKPTNILVADTPEGPVAKIIDFGIAKLIESSSGQTTQGTVLGTPDYMSPEQADSAGRDVDIRSDIYSAGVVLFELLVGALPYERQGSQEHSYVQALQRIATQEVPRPSERVTSLGGAQEHLQQRGGLTLDQLRKHLRGEVDWICLKALERERSQRYQSIAELAADIRRHLLGEPVSVGPPGLGYRLRKLARRHRAVVAASILVFAALVAATITSSTFYLREQNAHRSALQSAALEGAAKRQSEHAVRFLRRVLVEMNARGASGELLSLTGALAVAMQDLDEAVLSSEEAASAKHAVATILTDMKLRSMAKLVYESALEDFAVGNPRVFDHALCILELADLRTRFDRDFTTSEELTKQALQMAEVRLAEEPFESALLHFRSVPILEQIGEQELAVQTLRKVVDQLREQPFLEHQPQAARMQHASLLRLAHTLQQQGAHEEALALQLEAQRASAPAGFVTESDALRNHRRLEHTFSLLGRDADATAHRDAARALAQQLREWQEQDAATRPVAGTNVTQDKQGFLYGRVVTRLGDRYTGVLRWGSEEAFWDDLFHASKIDLPYARSVEQPSSDSDDADDGDPEAPSGVAHWKTRTSYEDPFQMTLCVVRFGDIARLDIHGDDWAHMHMKSGEIVEVGGGTNDVNGTLVVEDVDLGTVHLTWGDLESITFEKTPTDLFVPAYRLFGRVTTNQEQYEGYVQWDNQECLSTDILDAMTMEAEMQIAMGQIVSIERRSSLSSQVVLEDGRSLHLGRSNDVDDRNRGIMVEDPDVGRISIPCNQFERIDFTHAPTSGQGYDEYIDAGVLRGTVVDRDDAVHQGEIVFDLDETRSWESLGGVRAGAYIEIPFGRIASVIPLGEEGSRVILRNGVELELQSTRDVSQRNGGVIVLANDERNAQQYIEWSRVRRIDFER